MSHKNLQILLPTFVFIFEIQILCGALAARISSNSFGKNRILQMTELSRNTFLGSQLHDLVEVEAILEHNDILIKPKIPSDASPSEKEIDDLEYFLADYPEIANFDLSQLPEPLPVPKTLNHRNLGPASLRNSNASGALQRQTADCSLPLNRVAEAAVNRLAVVDTIVKPVTIMKVSPNACSPGLSLTFA